jgi:lysophospholipase L1-like esterase
MFFALKVIALGAISEDTNSFWALSSGAGDMSRVALNPDEYIALGCGVTEGSWPTEGDPWPERLEDMLSGINVVNLGDSRTYASHGAYYIKEYMQEYSPQYVLVLYGINDVKIGISNSDILDDLRYIAQKAQQYGADVVMGTIPKVPVYTSYEKSRVDSINNSIKNMGITYGFTVVDVAAALNSDDYFLWDGLHPTRQGQQLIAETFKDGIRITTLSGDGTIESPYEINNLADFQEFYTNEKLFEGYYILKSDIDLSATVFSSSVVDRTFAGHFDGNHHKISNMAMSTTDPGFRLGLFSILSGTIKNLGIENVSIVAGDNSDAVGVICGGSVYGLVENCYATGTINIGSDSVCVGGLCGANSGAIESSYSSVSIYVNDSSHQLGGISGANISGSISNCYSVGAVNGWTNSVRIGGVCGYNALESSIYYSYSASVVLGEDAVGGVCGTNSVGSVVNFSFWDEQVSGVTNSAGGIGKTTEQMQQSNTFVSAGWNFEDIWQMDGYPKLQVLHRYSGGDGSLLDPYIIACKDDILLLNVSQNDYYKHFIMTNDIDLVGATFNKAVIAPDIDLSTSGFQGKVFSGTFDGNGHVIKNLAISSSGAENFCLGLFGWVQGIDSKIMNLSVEDASITGGDSSILCGGLCGVNFDGLIENSYFSGSVSFGSSSQNQGLLCGFNGGTINNCYVSGNLTVGDNSTGTGGFCGLNSAGTIDKCYSSITMNIGSGSAIGGFCGSNSGAINSSFWDIQISGLLTSSGGIGKTTLQMQTQATFETNSWDFVDTWCMSKYPELRSFALPFDIWLSDSGAPAEERSWNDDPANDGIETIWKYAAGLDLLTAYSMTNVFYYNMESNEFSVIYYKSKSADAVILPEWKESLMDETWMTGSGLVNSKVSETSNREKWKASIPMQSNGYIRIKAEIEVNE